MADKRMFSLQIVDSDSFLDLPTSAQALYFHLGMRADDDGFLNNAKTIAKIVGASTKDFELLVEKKFVMSFTGGVSLIKHWKINNYIAKDRYKKSVYSDILSQLVVKENNSYSFSGQSVDKAYTQSSIDKISIDKSSIDKISEESIVLSPIGPETTQTKESSLIKQTEEYSVDKAFNTFWEVYPKKVGKGNVEKWFKKKRPSKSLVDKMVSAIETQKMSDQWQDVKYIPLPMTWLNQERWGDELPVQPALLEARKMVQMEKSMDELLQEEANRILDNRKKEAESLTAEEVDIMLEQGISSISKNKKI